MWGKCTSNGRSGLHRRIYDMRQHALRNGLVHSVIIETIFKTLAYGGYLDM
jgi:hypothetical protein